METVQANASVLENTIIDLVDVKETKKGLFKNLFKKKSKSNELSVINPNSEAMMILFEQIKNITTENHMNTIKMVEESNARIEKLEKAITSRATIKEDVIDVNVKLTVEPAMEGDKIVMKSHKLYQSREDMLNEICKWHPQLTKQDILSQIILEAYNKYKPLTSEDFNIENKKND